LSNVDRRSHTRAVWTALFVTVLWSSSWVLIRIGLDDEDLPPITFAGLRYTVAALVLIGWASARPAIRAELGSLPWAMWRPLLVLGVVFYAVTQGAQFVAIDSQPAATTSLMLAPTPFLVAVLSQYSIGEAVRPRQILGAGLMVVGAFVFFAGDLGATLIGMVASVIGLSANVMSSLLGRSINRRQHLSPLTITATSMTVGAVLLLGTGLITEGIPSLGWAAIAVVVWLAVVNTAWAFTLWNTSLRRLAAVESAAINNTMLIQIAVLAWIFLGEAPGAVGVIGIVIVSTGALLAQGVKLRRLAQTSLAGRPTEQR
jgi:drug/metabolite transporter (DMT)-like permease